MVFLVLVFVALATGSSIPAHAAGPTLADAQRAFFNAHYQAAADLALALQWSDASNLAAHEVRASALHFQLRDALGDHADKGKAFKQCLACPDLLMAFLSGTAHGQAVARGRLQMNPNDAEALFFLGKLNLNYVWLHVETLGRKTGWNEYWEARRSLDAVLKDDPRHSRARVARAWIDYIVDTKMARGTRWMLGGGSKKRAFIGAREAAGAESEFFTRVEAEFALWEMLVRERNVPEATTIAQKLARDFPENRKLAKFLNAAERADSAYSPRLVP
jgi:hypothetical protein